MLFLALVALATAECAQILGVLLVFTLMVGPAAAAQRLMSGVGRGLLVSAGLALAEAWAGLTLAFYTDWPSSFWITALSAAVYLLSALPRLGWRRKAAPVLGRDRPARLHKPAREGLTGAQDG